MITAGLRTLARGFNLDRYLGRFKPKSYGDHERAITCPMCEKPEKLWVNVEKQQATCYYCEEGYDLLGLIQLLEDTTFTGAVEVLRDGSTYNVNRPLSSLVRGMMDDAERDSAIEVEADKALATIELPRGFRSYADAWPEVPKYFRKRGIPKHRAIQYGLGFCTDGFYYNRMIVPIYMFGRLVSFHARYMKKKPPKGIKKVLYPKGTKSNQMLFNWDIARKRQRLVVCEDPFSAMAVGLDGTATFGTKLGKGQLRLLLTARAEEIIFLWDNDAAGGKAADVAERLANLGVNVRVAALPDDRDPDELSREELEAVLSGTRPAGLAGVIRGRLRSQSEPVVKKQSIWRLPAGVKRLALRTRMR